VFAIVEVVGVVVVNVVVVLSVPLLPSLLLLLVVLVIADMQYKLNILKTLLQPLHELRIIFFLFYVINYAFGACVRHRNVQFSLEPYAIILPDWSMTLGTPSHAYVTK
jgi:hypothetical protein